MCIFNFHFRDLLRKFLPKTAPTRHLRFLCWNRGSVEADLNDNAPLREALGHDARPSIPPINDDEPLRPSSTVRIEALTGCPLSDGPPPYSIAEFVQGL